MLEIYSKGIFLATDLSHCHGRIQPCFCFLQRKDYGQRMANKTLCEDCDSTDSSQVMWISTVEFWRIQLQEF
jgi:hypothetical protein